MTGRKIEGEEISSESLLAINGRNCRVCDIVQTSEDAVDATKYFLLTISSMKRQFGAEVFFEEEVIGHVASFDNYGAKNVFDVFTLVELNELGQSKLENTRIDESEVINPIPPVLELHDGLNLRDEAQTYSSEISCERTMLNIRGWPDVPQMYLDDLFEAQFLETSPARIRPGTPISQMGKTVGYCIAYFPNDSVAVCQPAGLQAQLPLGMEPYTGKPRGPSNREDRLVLEGKVDALSALIDSAIFDNELEAVA